MTLQNIPKVLAAKGLKQVGQITAAERGTLVTVCCCASAVGKLLPPAIVFPRVHFKNHMIKGAPPGTLGLATQSGWMNSELFPRVLNHFIKHMDCSIENPAVVFMDNHESHFGIEVIEMARMIGLSIITFPPHTSHKLQPLDVAVYGPLKCHYKKALNEWNLSHPACRITIYDLPECFSRAFFRALSFENIVSGFKTGIWPLNSEVFADDDFLATTVFSNNIVEQETGTRADTTSSARNLYEPQVATSSANSSFQDLTKIRPLPKRNAENQQKRKVKKRPIGCKLITSTPEKEAAKEKKKPKKQMKLQPKKKTAAKTFFKTLNTSSDYNENDHISVHEESSNFEEDFSELDQHSELTAKDPRTEDFVLVKLVPVNSSNAIYYVGQISDVTTDDGEKEYLVEFYRQSRKMCGRFTKPNVKDTDVVNRDDIVMCLPKPITTGGTKRCASMLKFSVDLEDYHCQSVKTSKRFRVGGYRKTFVAK